MGTSTDDLYDLAPEPTPVRKVQTPVPLTYQTAPAAVVRAPAEPEAIRYLWMPIWLLGGGIVVELVAALIRERDWRIGLTVVGIQVIVGTAILLAGVWIAAKLRGLDLGTLRSAAMKLAAIAVAPDALSTLMAPVLDHVPLGGLVAWVISFALYFALFGVFFDLDASDTWYCVWVIFLVELAVYLALTFGLVPWIR